MDNITQSVQLEFLFSDRKIVESSILRDILYNSLRLGKISRLIYDAIIMLLEDEEKENGI